ncbi:MAG: ATP-binding protein [Muribaculum sp.]|nr:ATP-binding protein [Muribaculum sp.]
MDLRKEYYSRMLDMFMSKYGIIIDNASEGHCMKVTGFPLEVLTDLRHKISSRTTDAECYILSETISGADYITPTKLIELRNDLTKPILILIPVNSNTSAEDSYGNATFQDLSVKSLDEMVLSSLLDEIGGNKTISDVLKYADKNLTVTVNDKINYLLYAVLNGKTDEVIGNGIFYLGLIPDSTLSQKKEYTQTFLMKNDECISIMSDFSSTIADRVVEIPIKPNTLQKEVAAFLKTNSQVNSRIGLCQQILEYPSLNFSQWEKVLTNVLELGKLHITNVELGGKAYSEKEGDAEVLVDSKGAKVKLRIHFFPKPSKYEALKKVRIALMNGDGFYKEVDLLTKKVSENKQGHRDIQITIPYEAFDNGTYFFHVFAEDENGTVLNTKDEFKVESIQEEWLKEETEENGMSKDEFQQRRRALLTSDSNTFFLKNKDKDSDSEEEEIGTRMKIRNVLMAYFRYRIELNRKGKYDDDNNLPMPKRVAIVEKNGKVSKNTSEDELHSWQVSTHLETFQLRYDADNNYQIPLPKKLLALQRALLKKYDQLSTIDAVITDNYTDVELKSIVVVPVDTDAPQSLLDARGDLFKAIRESAPDETGVIETFEVFKEENLSLIKNYVQEYRNWLSDVLAGDIDSKEAVTLQSIDTVSLQVEMPDGRTTTTKIITPLHPLRLAWLINIYDQYEEWEQKTQDDVRYRKPDVWYKKLDKLFYGELNPEIAPLVIVDDKRSGYMQYVGELCFGWGLYANPLQEKDDTFSTGFRQLKAYLSQLFNIGVQYRIDSDVNQAMVYRLMHKYIVQHPYINKLIINLFNAGDATVFADNLVQIEKATKGTVFDIHYEIRLFCNDKRFPQGEALKELMNPETSVSEEAENFSQADDNRLFPKLRFSINSIDEFVRNPHKFPAHMSFLINPFPTQASLKRNKTSQMSFYLNGVVMRPIVQVDNAGEGSEIQWQRFISDTPMQTCTPFAEDSQNLFGNIQHLIATSMTSDHEMSVPSLILNIKDTNSEMLSLVHDVSDWVVTFDKNMGPEFYDMPCKAGEEPYLLDYIPSAELNGISSFLTCRPTSEIEGIMAPHFKAFGIDVSDKTSFMDLLSDIRSVSSSMIMQLESSRNKVFEVLGTTLMKRMLKGKGLLDDSFIIPIDLHQSLFTDLDSASMERADDLLVDFHPQKREIVFTVIEIKCRQNLTDDELFSLQEKMQTQIDNTILALKTNFDPDFKRPDRLDRELRTIELQSLLLFYARRAARYKYLNEETAKEYEEFILSLQNEPYSIRFKKMGFIYEFQSDSYQRKEILDETVFYILGKPMIEMIIEDCERLKTSDINRAVADEEMRTDFETSDRILRENSFRINNDVSQEHTSEDIPVVEPSPEVTEVSSGNEPAVVKPNEDIWQTDTTSTPENRVNTPDDVIEPAPKPIEPSSPIEELQPHVETPDVTPVSDEVKPAEPIIDFNYIQPKYDILVGRTSGSEQYGILGESINGHRKIALDLSETNTISLFGVQGGGKSYTIGTVTEMTLKQFSNVNILPGPMASVIFHYSESQDYPPEFTSMVYPNDEAGQLKKLKDVYGAEAGKISDVIMLCPEDKVEDRQEEYPLLEIHPIKFHSTDLNVQDWQFLLKAIGNDSTYITQLKQIMKALRKNLNLEALKENVENSELLSTSQKALAKQRLSFAEEYIDDTTKLGSLLRPGRLIIVDLRDEFISEDDALGLFVIMLNVFAGVKQYEGQKFNKFIVFDEAHKYMGNKDLTSTIVTAIREMRHKGVSLMIASQDPMSLPSQIIELSSVVLLHKFNSPQWVKHIQKSITQLQSLSSSDMANLVPGEAYLWATKATDKGVTMRPMKISTRPRVTKHGGDTIKAI